MCQSFSRQNYGLRSKGERGGEIVRGFWSLGGHSLAMLEYFDIQFYVNLVHLHNQKAWNFLIQLLHNNNLFPLVSCLF
jgi:hypothetical protein